MLQDQLPGPALLSIAHSGISSTLGPLCVLSSVVLARLDCGPSAVWAPTVLSFAHAYLFLSLGCCVKRFHFLISELQWSGAKGSGGHRQVS